MRVLSFGEILWDIIEGKYYIGGAPFNFASHITRCGAETYMVSRLGKDEWGEKAFEEARKLGIYPNFIQWDKEKPTGTVDVFLKNGQPSYTINPEVAYDYLDFEELIQSGLKEESFDMFGFGSLAQRNEASRSCLYRILESLRFEHIFYDVNLRKDCYSAEIVNDSLKYSTILKLNDDEVPIISEFTFSEKMGIEDFCKRAAAERGQEIVIVTAGGAGCFIYHENKLHKVPGKKVKVVDTVGAGDSFSAAFLAMYFKKGDPVYAASVANQLGAFVASSHGPIPTYSDELKKILEID
ncbi:MAG: PfkB family carbohydrate kinase [Bacteroidia bacterium]|nr:PfkB family carbohydrate kinase [Bacteroidia bacterium]